MSNNRSNVEISRSEWFIVNMASKVLKTDSRQVLKEFGLQGAAQRVAAFQVAALQEGNIGAVRDLIEDALWIEQEEIRQSVKEEAREALRARTPRQGVGRYFGGLVGFFVGVTVTLFLVGLVSAFSGQ